MFTRKRILPIDYYWPMRIPMQKLTSVYRPLTIVKTISLVSLILTFCICGFSQSRLPAPGMPDTSFGYKGEVTTVPPNPYYYLLRDVIFQPDGKIIAVGGQSKNVTWGYAQNFLLIRYNTDGSLDSSFGDSGIAIAGSGGQIVAESGVIQSDGKIVVAGQYDGDIGLARFNIDGSLDPAFGSGGLVRTDLTNFDERANKVFLLSSGKFVVVGTRISYSSISPDSTITGVFVVRYMSDGTLDYTYGQGGKSVADLSSSPTETWRTPVLLNSAAMDNDGTVVLNCTGSRPRKWDSSWSSATIRKQTLRFDGDGNLDRSFGQGGILTNPQSSYYKILRFLQNGRMEFSNGSRLFVMNSNGSVEQEIFSGQSQTIDGHEVTPGNLMVQNNGKVVAAGWINNTNPQYGFAQYLPDGRLDTSFGTNGLTIGRFDVYRYEQFSVLQPDGRLLNVGHRTGPYNIVLARYYGDPVIGSVQDQER